MVGVKEPMIVGSGLKKQDILIGNSTGTAWLVVWDKKVGRKRMVATNRGGLMVRKFCKINFLSTSQQSSMIEEISDIGKVEEGHSDCAEEGSSRDNLPGTLHDVRVVKCTAKLTDTFIIYYYTYKHSWAMH